VIAAESARVRQDDGGVQVLARAAAILRLLAADSPGGLALVVSRVGVRFPAFCTANGKALLAQLPPDEVKLRLPRLLEAGGKQGPVRRRSLLAELEEVRRTGLGFDREEHCAGSCGVGAALTDIDGSAASIAVPMPTARFDEDADTVAGALLRVRAEVQIALQSA